jgi:transposase
LAADPAAAQRLARWRRCLVTAPPIARIVTSAQTTLGVPLCQRDGARLQQYAALALSAAREVAVARRQLSVVTENVGPLRRQAEVVGLATASVLWARLGDPRRYPCGAAYRKAMGLNLKERSSGRHKGQLKITRRGPALVRRWLYFAAMRLTQRPGVREWYQQKKAKDKDHGKGALIAIARKLALALYHVGAHGAVFESARLFPGVPRVNTRARKITEAPVGRG